MKYRLRSNRVGLLGAARRRSEVLDPAGAFVRAAHRLSSRTERVYHHGAGGPKSEIPVSLSWGCGRRILVCLAMAFVSLGLSSQPVSAQVTYRYTGNRFNVFSCGGVSFCPTPNPANTSYTTDDFVTATLTLNEALPGNLNLRDIRGFAGFKLTINDRHQEFTREGEEADEVMVSTDAEGSIIGPWSVIISGNFFPNRGIASVNWPGGRGVSDVGFLSAPNGSFPDAPRDSGQVFQDPGAWNEPPLVANPRSLSFSFVQMSEAAIRRLFVSNTRSDSLPFQVAVTTQTGGPWLSVTPESGDVTPVESGRSHCAGRPGRFPPGDLLGRNPDLEFCCSASDGGSRDDGD